MAVSKLPIPDKPVEGDAINNGYRFRITSDDGKYTFTFDMLTSGGNSGIMYFILKDNTANQNVYNHNFRPDG